MTDRGDLSGSRRRGNERGFYSAALTALLIGLCGCASSAKWLASPREYASYRKTRVAETVEARLTAGHRYLAYYPQGHWVREVRDWFYELEPRYYQAALNHRPALELYLEALPRGPHAEDVALRLVELERARERRDEQEAAVVREAHAHEAALVRAERGRRALVSESLAWVERLSKLRNFHLALNEFDRAFVTPLGVDTAGAACSEVRCERTLRFVYGVPADGRQRDVSAEFVARVQLVDGMVERASLAGPEWFSRLAEAATVRLAAPGDFQARAEAIGHAVYLIGLASEARFPEGHCRKPAISPIVLLRECDGLRLVGRAGLEVGALDSLMIEPIGP